MKRIFVIAATLLTIFSGCKKSSSSPSSGSITATIDGTTQTFNVDAVAVEMNLSGAYTFTIAGLTTSSTSTAYELALGIDGQQPVTTGTYTASGPIDAAEIAYTLPGNILYSSGATGITVTITSLTSTNVKGTFGGTLSLLNGTGPATKTVTNGTFDLAVKN